MTIIIIGADLYFYYGLASKNSEENEVKNMAWKKCDYCGEEYDEKYERALDNGCPACPTCVKKEEEEKERQETKKNEA